MAAWADREIARAINSERISTPDFIA